ADMLPTLGRCEVVHHDFGDMRIKLFAGESSVVMEAAPSVTKAVQEMINLNAPVGEAQSTLRSVSPQAAQHEFGPRDQSGDRVLLIHGAAPSVVSPPGSEKKAGTDGVTAPRKVYASYQAKDSKALAAALELDLPKVFRWQNVWRIAGNVASPSA